MLRLSAAVYEIIIASTRKTQGFRCRKFQNGGKFLWALSTHIIFSMGARLNLKRPYRHFDAHINVEKLSHENLKDNTL